MRAAVALIVAVLIAPATGCGLRAQSFSVQPSKAETVTETRTVPLAQGSTLKVENVNGFIRVEAWDRAEVQFTGEFKASSKGEQVEVVFTPSSKGLQILGKYPKSSQGSSYRGPECRMTLKVPRQVKPQLESVNGEIILSGTLGDAKLETVNGEIEVRQMEGAVKAETVNGRIQVKAVKGRVALQTVNGGVEVRGLDTRNQGLSIQTVNGNVSLERGELKGKFNATTVNGGIAFNAKGADQVDIKRHRATAVFLGSDQALSLSTVNGSITIE
ncbi:MAG: DUF4097 family beta strand repeat-containing protein [Firmicutes bacterium]|nr:DUF4097 family beta strand repeat-containing protein [Bacillota bacterium]